MYCVSQTNKQSLKTKLRNNQHKNNNKQTKQTIKKNTIN